MMMLANAVVGVGVVWTRLQVQSPLLYVVCFWQVEMSMCLLFVCVIFGMCVCVCAVWLCERVSV